MELCICHRGSLHIAAIKFCGPADDQINCAVQNWCLGREKGTCLFCLFAALIAPETACDQLLTRYRILEQRNGGTCNNRTK